MIQTQAQKFSTEWANPAGVDILHLSESMQSLKIEDAGEDVWSVLSSMMRELETLSASVRVLSERVRALEEQTSDFSEEEIPDDLLAIT